MPGRKRSVKRTIGSTSVKIIAQYSQKLNDLSCSVKLQLSGDASLEDYSWLSTGSKSVAKGHDTLAWKARVTPCTKEGQLISVLIEIHAASNLVSPEPKFNISALLRKHAPELIFPHDEDMAHDQLVLRQILTDYAHFEDLPQFHQLTTMIAPIDMVALDPNSELSSDLGKVPSPSSEPDHHRIHPMTSDLSSSH